MTDALTLEDLELLDKIATHAIEPVEPPAAVRARVLAAVRRPRLDESVPGEHESRTVRANEGRWKEIAPGVQVRKMSADKARGTVVLMVRLAPNALLPAHDHHGSEDTFVVAGSCQIGAIGLAAGDFHHVDSTAHHGDVVASAEGCTLLLTVDAADAA